MAQHNLSTVVGFEFLRTVRKRGFWIATLAVPVVIGVIFALSFISGTSISDSEDAQAEVLEDGHDVGQHERLAEIELEGRVAGGSTALRVDQIDAAFGAGEQGFEVLDVEGGARDVGRGFVLVAEDARVALGDRLADPAEPRRAEPIGVLPGRESLDTEAPEFALLVFRSQELARALRARRPRLRSR